MTNTQVHEAVIQWLSGLLGIQFVKDRQGINRPTLPYGMVDLATWDELREHPGEIDWEELGTLNQAGLNELKATPLVEIEWTFQVFVYGDGCENYMRQLQAARHLAQMHEPLMPGLHVHDVGAVNSIPELINEQWEPRAQANLMVRGWSDDGFVVDTIETNNFDFTRQA